ncbi:unnamed protein product, partial [Discosporangium mesarthrocarpum]
AVDAVDKGSEIEFSGDVFFKDNIADLGGFAKYGEGLQASRGGHVFAERRGVVKFLRSSRAYFEDGKADFGGAIAAITRGEVIMSGKAEFKGNVAKECGGAIAADRKSFKDRSNKLKFKNNKDKNADDSEAGDCDNVCIGSSDDERAFPQGGKTCE